MLEILLSILVLVLAVPFALLVERYTGDEIPSYQFLFRPMLWFLVLMAALFYSINLVAALTFTFAFIFVLTIKIKTGMKNNKKRKAGKLKLNKKAK
jgi:hypothetical protein